MRPNLAFCTSNQGKIREFSQFFQNKQLDYNVESVLLDLPEYQGTSDFIIGQKLKAAIPHVSSDYRYVLVEDTSLIFNAWKSLPGPYIKSFLDSLGSEGLPTCLKGFSDKTAVGECWIGLYDRVHDKSHVFVGRCHGVIVDIPRALVGESPFGWDSIFQPDEQVTPEPRVFAELSCSEKLNISHRGRALCQLVDILLATAVESKTD